MIKPKPVGSALDLLRKKHAERKAAIDAKDSGVSGLHDAFVESMGSGLAKLGAIADLRGDGWRSTKIDVVGKAVQVDVLLPATPMVDLNGIEFFDALFRSAEDVAPHVLKHVPMADLPAWLKAEEVALDQADGVTVPVAVVSAVMRKIMKAQGWKYIAKQSCWRSPVWLFPEVKIPASALLAHAKESMEIKGLVAKSSPEPDQYSVLLGAVDD